MTQMSLDIGGAETHVLELSKALSDMGVDVTVASNGGVYAEELKSYGIRHVLLPLHSKNPLHVAKSYFGLKRLIKSEKFDIVHSHARIPAYICGILQKKLHFRFVCSAHAHFKVNSILRAVSDWGERTITISDDIKQYLIDEYSLSPDNIFTTINGIDMSRFSENAESVRDCTVFSDSLGLRHDSLRIVFVSRMDADCSMVAEQLVSIMPQLCEKHSNLELILVGGGSEYKRIKALCKDTNLRIGKPMLHAVGGQTNVEKFIALGDIFVGVSRAALEAMSASKPVILAGNEGYLGIFSKENQEIAISTNFCCRGCELPNEENLKSEIEALLSLPKSKLYDMGKYNRALIEEKYSSRRMAEDCLNVYHSLAPYDYKKYGDILLSGYYGFGNMGDDSLLLSIIKNLKEINPTLRVTALTKNPVRVTRKYGVKCVNRFNLFAVSREMKHAKLLISGGGSLLQNNTSTKSLEYYILIMKMAKRRGLPVMVYANGIGPIYGDYSRTKVKNVLDTVDYISLREPSSFELLESIGVKATVGDKISISADPALSLEPASESRKNYILDKFGINISQKRYFAVSLREWSSLRTSEGARSISDFEDEIASALAEIYNKFNIIPIFVPVQKDYDEEICRKICEKTNALCRCGKICLSDLSASELIAILRDMVFVIGMRLHVLIYASAAGTPTIGLSYDPKVDAFLEYISQPKALNANTVTKDDILSSATKVLQYSDELCPKILKRASELRELAKQDAKKAAELAKSI